MLNWIKKFISIEFSFENTSRSVSTLTKTLSKTVTALEQHSIKQRSLADKKVIAAGKLLSERNDHMEEASKAAAVSSKIGALLS